MNVYVYVYHVFVIFMSACCIAYIPLMRTSKRLPTVLKDAFLCSWHGPYSAMCSGFASQAPPPLAPYKTVWCQYSCFFSILTNIRFFSVLLSLVHFALEMRSDAFKYGQTFCKQVSCLRSSLCSSPKAIKLHLYIWRQLLLISSAALNNCCCCSCCC